LRLTRELVTVSMPFGCRIMNWVVLAIVVAARVVVGLAVRRWRRIVSWATAWLPGVSWRPARSAVWWPGFHPEFLQPGRLSDPAQSRGLAAGSLL